MKESEKALEDISNRTSNMAQERAAREFNQFRKAQLREQGLAIERKKNIPELTLLAKFLRFHMENAEIQTAMKELLARLGDKSRKVQIEIEYPEVQTQTDRGSLKAGKIVLYTVQGRIVLTYDSAESVTIEHNGFMEGTLSFRNLYDSLIDIVAKYDVYGEITIGSGLKLHTPPPDNSA